MTKKSLKIMAVGCIVCLAVMNLGTIRKKENPILKTQTDAIAYKAKMEEIKDGVKGAPSPTMEFYHRSKFLVDPPVEKDQSEDTKGSEQESRIPKLGEPIPEDLTDYETPQETQPVRAEMVEETTNQDETEWSQLDEEAPGESKEKQESEEDAGSSWWDEDSQ